VSLIAYKKKKILFKKGNLENKFIFQIPFLYIFISCSHYLLLGSAQHPQKALPFESSKAPRLCKLGRKCVPAPKIDPLHRQTVRIALQLLDAIN